MTISTTTEGGESPTVSVRLDRELHEWLDVLVADHFHSKSAVLREAVRRVVVNPSAMWGIRRPWTGDVEARWTEYVRIEPKLVEQLNDLERDGWVRSVSEAIRVGLALVANDRLESADLALN